MKLILAALALALSLSASIACPNNQTCRTVCNGDRTFCSTDCE